MWHEVLNSSVQVILYNRQYILTVQTIPSLPKPHSLFSARHRPLPPLNDQAHGG